MGILLLVMIATILFIIIQRILRRKNIDDSFYILSTFIIATWVCVYPLGLFLTSTQLAALEMQAKTTCSAVEVTKDARYENENYIFPLNLDNLQQSTAVSTAIALCTEQTATYNRSLIEWQSSAKRSRLFSMRMCISPKLKDFKLYYPFKKE